MGQVPGKKPMKKHEMLALATSALLLGVATFFLFAAVSGISGVADQWANGRPLAVITEWAFNFRPKDVMAIFSAVLVVVSTYFLAGYSLIVTGRAASSPVFCFSVLSSFWLLGAAYFMFYLSAAASSQIVVLQKLYSEKDPLPPTQITPPTVDGWIWLALAVVYALALLVIAVRTRRKHEDVHGSAK